MGWTSSTGSPSYPPPAWEISRRSRHQRSRSAASSGCNSRHHAAPAPRATRGILAMGLLASAAVSTATFAIHELAKPARPSACGFVLTEERQFLFVKLLEEV